MIREAARAGVDYVKFQTFNPAELTTPSAPQAAYQCKATGTRGRQRRMLEKLCLSQPEFRLLKKECRRRGIGFLSTAFDLGSLRFVESLKPDFHKISSGDIDNLPYLRAVARYGRAIILSTGMATFREIKTALMTLAKAGLPRNKITVLQCHTEYPTRPHEANLQVMDTLRKKFKVRSGLSDHTPGIGVSLAAVARGAAVIEKHFTLNKAMKGPDHQASLSPRELFHLVKGIRDVEMALGDGIKRPSPREQLIKMQARKFLVATRPIKKGEKFTSANLGLKRSGGGIPAARWDFFLGKESRANYRTDEIIRS